MADEIYHIYAPQDETADTESSRAIKDQLGNVIDETYATKAEVMQKSNIVKVATFADLPEEGDTINLYIVAEHFAYSWNGEAYQQISTIRSFDVADSLTLNDIEDICVLTYEETTYIASMTKANETCDIFAQNGQNAFIKQHIALDYHVIDLFNDANKVQVIDSSMFATNDEIDAIFEQL